MMVQKLQSNQRLQRRLLYHAPKTSSDAMTTNASVMWANKTQKMAFFSISAIKHETIFLRSKYAISLPTAPLAKTKTVARTRTTLTTVKTTFKIATGKSQPTTVSTGWRPSVRVQLYDDWNWTMCCLFCRPREFAAISKSTVCFQLLILSTRWILTAPIETIRTQQVL